MRSIEANRRRPTAATDRTPERLGFIPGRNPGKADGITWETVGGRLFFKDYRRRPCWIRWTVGRFLLRREARALRAAEGIDGVPRLLGQPHPDCLTLEWVPGSPPGDWPDGVAPADARRRLLRILAELHAAGVAVGDLHRSDVLIGPAGEVHVVDLATALVLRPGDSAHRRRWFARWCERDRGAAARIAARWSGLDPLAEMQEAVGTDAVRRWRRRRRLKRWWDALRGRA